jgi:hypothetical protein
MITTADVDVDHGGISSEQRKMLLDLRLVLNMLSPEQVARIVLEARRRGLADVAALTERLSRRGRGRPRRNTFEEVDAWLIVWANELFRSGHAPSAWAAITRVVEGAWAAWDMEHKAAALRKS